jgi:hypothetical protein
VTGEDCMRDALASIQVNDDFTEATVGLRDGSRIVFRHRVGERLVTAVDAVGREDASTLAGTVLARITSFRLNGKHLDVQFDDGSRWEAGFRGADAGGNR